MHWVMRAFGDPKYLRRNLWGGFLITALSFFLLGHTVGAAAVHGTWVDQTVTLLFAIALIVGGIGQFALGMRVVAADRSRTNDSPSSEVSHRPHRDLNDRGHR